MYWFVTNIVWDDIRCSENIVRAGNSKKNLYKKIIEQELEINKCYNDDMNNMSQNS